MDFEKLIIEVARILEALKIPYAITGGYAVSIWGRLRATFDIDVIVTLPASKSRALAEALRKVSKMSYVDEGAVVQAVARKGEFNFIHVESGIKIDFWVLGDDSFSESQLQRRIPRKIRGKKIYFLSPEDLILSKLLWHKESGSELQTSDVRSILEMQKNLDRTYLKEWAKEHSTLPILKNLWQKHRKNAFD